MKNKIVQPLEATTTTMIANESLQVIHEKKKVLMKNDVIFRSNKSLAG